MAQEKLLCDNIEGSSTTQLIFIFISCNICVCQCYNTYSTMSFMMSSKQNLV